MWDAAKKDAAGNAVTGDVTVVDSHNVYVSTDRDTVGVVGVDDIVVVAAREL